MIKVAIPTSVAESNDWGINAHAPSAGQDAQYEIGWIAARRRRRVHELAPRYWRTTRARLDPKELELEIGWLTIPEPPLPTP